jgi:putative transposase
MQGSEMSGQLGLWIQVVEPYGEGWYTILSPRSSTTIHPITLTTDERVTLLDYLRHAPDPHLRLRAHILLLLADGFTWAMIGSVLYCSSRTISRWKTRFDKGRLPALLGRSPGPAPQLGTFWLTLLVGWVTEKTPRLFGFLRSRWSCELLALLLWQKYEVRVSRETVRRRLREADIVWRRPRPVLKRCDDNYDAIYGALRQLLLHLPDDETVVFQDEVDVQLNPKIGSMWMRRGQQAAVVTPGDNDKRYLAGSWHWRTGRLLTTCGAKRDGELFVRHLHQLRHTLRRYRVIHVICDNAKFHAECWPVWEFCHRHGEQVKLHFLPKYAPELNLVERVWWILHEHITRNHQCQSMEELVDLVLAWVKGQGIFPLSDRVYKLPPDHKLAA